MRAKRTDQNQKEIVKALRDMGCSVFDTSSVGKGYPDLNVGINGHTFLVEIKKDNKAKFTPAQLLFQAEWKGSPVYRINNCDEAIALVKDMV